MLTRIRFWWACRRLRSADPRVQEQAIDGLRRSPLSRADGVLIEILDELNEHTALLALKALADRRATSALPRLLDLVLDDNVTVRRAAFATVEAIDIAWRSRQCTREALQRLTELVSDKSNANQIAVVEALASIDLEQATPTLLASLPACKGEVFDAIRNVLPPLHQYRETPAIASLVEECGDRLASDDNEYSRRSLELLAEVAGPKAVKKLVLALPSVPRTIFADVLETLDQLDSDWPQRTDSAEVVAGTVGLLDIPEALPLAQRVLPRLSGPNCAPVCIGYLLSETSSAQNREFVRQTLHNWDSDWSRSAEVTATFYSHLSTSTVHTSELGDATTEFLENLRSRRTLSQLQEVLELAVKCRSPRFWLAAESSMNTVAPEIIDELSSLAFDPATVCGVRESAILALGWSESSAPQHLTALTEFATQAAEEPLLRAAAVRAVCRLSQDAGRDIIIGLVDSDSPDLLLEAAIESAVINKVPRIAGRLIQHVRERASSAHGPVVPILCMKALRNVTTPEEMRQLASTLLAEHSLLNYLRAHAGDCQTSPRGPRTALELDIAQAQESWNRHIASVTPQSVIADIHEGSRGGRSLLNQVAVTGWAKIRLMEKGIDLFEFLIEYDQLAHERRKLQVDLDARTLARLWGVGRYWREVKR